MAENSAYISANNIYLFQGPSLALKLNTAIGLSCDKELKVKKLPITITRF